MTRCNSLQYHNPRSLVFQVYFILIKILRAVFCIICSIFILYFFIVILEPSIYSQFKTILAKRTNKCLPSFESHVFIILPCLDVNNKYSWETCLLIKAKEQLFSFWTPRDNIHQIKILKTFFFLITFVISIASCLYVFQFTKHITRRKKKALLYVRFCFLFSVLSALLLKALKLIYKNLVCFCTLLSHITQIIGQSCTI